MRTSGPFFPPQIEVELRKMAAVLMERRRWLKSDATLKSVHIYLKVNLTSKWNINRKTLTFTLFERFHMIALNTAILSNCMTYKWGKY